MTRLAHAVAATLAFIVVSLFALPAWSLPRFALREGVPCSTCHVNPSGGGMRNAYGRYVYGPTRLPLGFPGSRERAPQLDLGDTLAFGADARTAYIDQRPKTGEGLRTFFQMQADLYVAARVFDGLTLYYDQGAYGSFEAIALYQKPLTDWASVYVKAGRFMPTYGLRLENHNLWIRQDIGYGPRDKEQGVEVGAQIAPFLVQVGLLNGVPGERQLDDNKGKAFVARVEALGRLGPLRLMFGGSYYRNQTGVKSDASGKTVDGRSNLWRAGLFGGASLGRFTYLAEADLVRLEPFSANKTDSKSYSFQSHQELDVLVVRGLELTFNFEYREPDLDTKSGSMRRVALGFEVYPMPNLELKALYRHVWGKGPASRSLDGLSEYIAMAHVFF
ncbi:MAG: hypothetical protein HYV09_02995 [Deltaproteobacteria bacterium]|nr:hypothetical protein [Deltaproteobacteria bacterium]